MTPEEKKELQEIVCLVERDLKSQDKARERCLVLIELCLLPIAVVIMLIIPSLAAPAVFIPNIALRGYQMWNGDK